MVCFAAEDTKTFLCKKWLSSNGRQALKIKVMAHIKAESTQTTSSKSSEPLARSRIVLQLLKETCAGPIGLNVWRPGDLNVSAVPSALAFPYSPSTSHAHRVASPLVLPGSESNRPKPCPLRGPPYLIHCSRSKVILQRVCVSRS